MPLYYTITLTSSQKSRLLAILAVENDRLDEAKAVFDRPGDVADYERIEQDMLENSKIYNLLATAKPKVTP